MYMALIFDIINPGEKVGQHLVKVEATVDYFLLNFQSFHNICSPMAMLRSAWLGDLADYQHFTRKRPLSESQKPFKDVFLTECDKCVCESRTGTLTSITRRYYISWLLNIGNNCRKSTNDSRDKPLNLLSEGRMSIGL